MKKEVPRIEGVRKPSSPFSHVVKAGDFLFLTSQLSCDLETGRIIKGTIGEQTRRALDNIKFLLESQGSTMGDVVKVAIYMRDAGKFREVDAVYRGYFTEGEEPVRVTIQAPSPIDGVDVEIEATAIVGKKRK